MNVARWILAFCGAVAIALVITLGTVVLTPPALQVGPAAPGSAAECATPDHSPLYFGVNLANTADTPIRLRGIDPGASDHVTVLDAWTLHDWMKGADHESFGVVDDPTSDGAPWADRQAVGDTVIPAHSELTLVIELALDSGARDGSLRELRVRADNSIGLQYAARSRTVLGFGSGTCSLLDG